jgi:HAD superfamily hydrolase (TIGR01509 family)
MPFPRRPQGVVFDMDGVIFDTEAVFRRSLVAVAAEMGHHIPDRIMMAMIGASRASGQAMVTELTNGAVDVVELWNLANARVWALSAEGKLLKAGVLEMLDLLDAEGTPRAIATSSYRDAVDHHLASHGLTHRFPIILAFGDYPRPKPEPDPYLAAVDRLGFAPDQCIALEDSYNGIRSAASAGVMTIMVPDLLDANDEMRALCVGVARDLNEVRGWLSAG